MNYKINKYNTNTNQIIAKNKLIILYLITRYTNQRKLYKNNRYNHKTWAKIKI